MNNNHKFRAWLPSENKMVYQETDLKSFINGLLDDAILMLFSGLYDIDNTPIYEGDIYNEKYIVYFKHGAITGGIYPTYTSPLAWRGVEDDDRMEIEEDLDFSWLKITGNIYENRS